MARPIAPMVTRFIEHEREERPELARRLEALDAQGMHELSGVLGRFEQANKADLDPQQRLLACRVLGRLRAIDLESLTLTNKILDYLDINADGHLSAREMELCVQVFEVFARAESDNDTLSVRELRMLYAVLRHFDGDDNHRLDNPEVRWLRQELTDGPAFMARQRHENPHLRRLLDES